MKNIAKIGCISIWAITGGLLAKIIYDVYERATKNKALSLDEIEKYHLDKKMVCKIGKGDELYMVAADNEQEIKKMCEELDKYDYRKEIMDKDLEYGKNCYWKNANKNEFKK